jgi:hypothetical protein
MRLERVKKLPPEVEKRFRDQAERIAQKCSEFVVMEEFAMIHKPTRCIIETMNVILHQNK